MIHTCASEAHPGAGAAEVAWIQGLGLVSLCATRSMIVDEEKELVLELLDEPARWGRAREATYLREDEEAIVSRNVISMGRPRTGQTRTEEMKRGGGISGLYRNPLSHAFESGGIVNIMANTQSWTSYSIEYIRADLQLTSDINHQYSISVTNSNHKTEVNTRLRHPQSRTMRTQPRIKISSMSQSSTSERILD